MNVVTLKNACIGMRVVRGPDWKWGDQDIGSTYGLIIKIDSSGWATVRWFSNKDESLRSISYRIGSNNEYDLKILEKPAFRVGDEVIITKRDHIKCVYDIRGTSFSACYCINKTPFKIINIVYSSLEKCFYYLPNDYEYLHYREDCLNRVSTEENNNSITTKTETNVPKVQRFAKSVRVSKRPTGVGIQSGRSKATISSRPISYKERACKG